MKLLTKLAISMVAVASMAQADVTLLGVDGGVTILGLRVGANAGLTVGTRPVHTAAPVAVSSSCPAVVQTTVACATIVSSPCSYVSGPCEVVEAPACPCPCDPCAK